MTSMITTSASVEGAESTGTDADSRISDARIYQQIMELMRVYGTQSSEGSFLSSLDSAISTTA